MNDLRAEKLLDVWENVRQRLEQEGPSSAVLEDCCARLTRSGLYASAWLGLQAEPESSYQVYGGQQISAMPALAPQLAEGAVPWCAEAAWRQHAVVCTEDPGATCTACPLRESYGSCQAVTVPILLGGEALGWLVLAREHPLDAHAMESKLLRQFAAMVGHAVHCTRLNQRNTRAQVLSHAAIDSTADAVVCVDVDCQVTYWNAAAEQLLGFHPSEVQGKHVSFMVPGYQKPLQRRLIETAFAKGTTGPVRVRRLHKDGREIPVELCISTISNAAGETLGLVGTMRDVAEQDQVRDELAKRDELLRRLAAQVPGFIYQFQYYADGRSRFPYASEGVREVYEVTPEQVEHDARLAYDRLHPDDLRFVIDSILKSYSTLERWHECYRVCLPERGVRWLEGDSVPERLEDGSVLWHGYIHDITENKMAEESLRASEDLFARAFHGGPLLMSISKVEDGTYLELNDNFVKVTGYAREKTLGRTSVEIGFITQAERERVIKVMQRDGRVRGMELELRKQSGEIFWCEYWGEIIFVNGAPRLLSIALDTTERRKVEAERDLLFHAIEQLAEVVVITDAEGAIEYVNPAFEKTTGYTAAEVAGQNPRILKSGEQDETFYAAMWQQLVRGESWRGRFVNRRKDRAVYTEEAVISPVRDAEGRVVNYVAVKRDITEELRLRAEREQLEAQYRQSQKMEAVGQLAGGIAHDFNNLLHVINGYTEMLLEDTPPDSQNHEVLSEVAGAGDRAASLVRQLLSFSRRQIMEQEDLGLSGVAVDTARMIRRLIGENIELRLKANAVEDLVHADRGMMEQVIINLCVNARDAMPSGGELSIETGPAPELPQGISPGAERGQGYVMMRVSDTGAGMTPDVRERVFEPFFTTKELGKGSGLGLSTVYGIVKQHQGHVHIRSAPGQGTSFTVYLPRVAKSAAPQAAEGSKEVRGGSETILLAEDDLRVRQLTGAFLEHAGYTVLYASDGEEAMRVYEEHAGDIALLIFDVIMPGLGGPGAYGQLRAAGHAVPVIFASGYSQDALDEALLNEPGVHLLQKPFHRLGVLRAIREALDAGLSRP